MKRNFTEIGLVGNGKKRNFKFENGICLFLKRKNSGPTDSLQSNLISDILKHQHGFW